jgi:hypothetical protein
MLLNSTARRPSSSVFGTLTGDNCRAPGRMLDTLLPIPDAEYPAFYPIGIKASCVYQVLYCIQYVNEYSDSLQYIIRYFSVVIL